MSMMNNIIQKDFGSGLSGRDIMIDLDNGYHLKAYTVGRNEYLDNLENHDKVAFVLHGGPGGAALSTLMSHTYLIEKDWVVISYDQLGNGDSDCPSLCDGGTSDLWSFDSYNHRFNEVLDSLHLNQGVHLIGHSFGGILAMEFAARNPERIQSLVLENTCHSIDQVNKRMDELKTELIGKNGLDEILKEQVDELEGCNHCEVKTKYLEFLNNHPDYKEMLAEIMIKNMYNATPEQAEKLKDLDLPVKMVNAINMEVMSKLLGLPFQFIGELSDMDLSNRLEAIKAETLIISGRLDYVPCECSIEMNEKITGSQLKIFENSGHIPMMSEMEGFQATLAAFLEKQVSLQEPISLDLEMKVTTLDNMDMNANIEKVAMAIEMLDIEVQSHQYQQHLQEEEDTMLVPVTSDLL